jgi:hypothetical protein
LYHESSLTLSDNFEITSSDLIPKSLSNMPIETELSYVPVINQTDLGATFDGKDIISVNQYETLNLTFNGVSEQFEDNFTIDAIAGYDVFSLNYNMVNLTAKRDFYPVETQGDTPVALSPTTMAIAQSFDVVWDYANFTGAKMYFEDDGNVGTYVIELILVKAALSGEPNMSNVYSSEIDGPFTVANRFPVSTLDNLPMYNFTEVTLERGKYFVVANVTVVGGPKNFWWYSYSSFPLDSDTYYKNDLGIWNLQLTDHTLIPQLLPTHANGSALNFNDLTQVNLQDNAVEIQTFNSPISSTGFHLLSCDASIELTFNNTYLFSKDIVVSSFFDALNSSSEAYSNYWTLEWSTSEADYSPYPDMNRSILVLTPTDWSGSSSCFYNDTDLLSSYKVSKGYQIALGFNISAGTYRLETTSPNYIEQLILSEESVPAEYYSLGYWTNDGFTAYGNEGSIVEFETHILNAEDTGSMNITLFDPNGKIIPLKTSLDTNLSYTDSTLYTKNGIISSGSGIFNSDLTFDPSVYGSDAAGQWTAFVYWSNGTQVGLFAKTICVEPEIVFEPSWETIPNSDAWTTTLSVTILRINGDSLRLRSDFYSISEPFLTPKGSSLLNSTVSYLTSWGLSSDFSQNGVTFNTTIPTGVNAGLHSITLEANSSQCRLQSVELDLEIVNQFNLIPETASIEINSTDEAVLRFQLVNMTDPLQGVIFPDDITVYINDELLAEGFYEQTTDGDWIVLNINMQTSGTHKVTVEVSKAGFRTDYTDQSIAFDYSVRVIPSDAFPPYLIVIIAIGGILLIVLLAGIIAMSRTRKTKDTVVDIRSKSAVVGLLDSVLAMKKILFVHSETSLPVFELDIGGTHVIDSALVSGFLSVVETMGKSLGGKDTGEIRRLEYRNFVVTGASSETYTVFLFSSDELIKQFQNRLFDLIMWFEYSFKISNGVWDGKKEIFNQRKKLIQDKVAESLYFWIYFPLGFNQQKSKDIKKLDKLEQRIAELAKKKGEVTIGSLLKKYDDYEMEDTLTAVFSLVNKDILRRSQFSSFNG